MNREQILVLGIGNLLWADEGFGVRAAEAFDQQYSCPDNVTIMDGGTQGMYLVPYVEQAEVLVVFDAIDYGLSPGTLKVIYNDDVPAFMGAKKMSLHQTGFQEVLATASLLGRCPQHIVLIGVQPELLDDYGGSLTDIVKAQIQPALEQAVTYLQARGVELTPRTDATTHSVTDASLAMTHYECERPSAQEACRMGDARVVQSQIAQFDPKPIDDMTAPMSVALAHRKPD